MLHRDTSECLLLGILTAAGDGVGLVGAGEGGCREYGRQCHEQTDYCFTHRISLSISFSTSAGDSSKEEGRASAS
jgi:hypothetical protein